MLKYELTNHRLHRAFIQNMTSRGGLPKGMGLLPYESINIEYFNIQ